jgi:cytochrome P450
VKDRPAITPMPPIAAGVELPWDGLVADPVVALAEARATYGDTFVVDSGSDRYLFTVDPIGVRSFYRLPESKASKGVADWRMLRRKMPDEIFAGRRVLPHDLFARDDVANYLANLQQALATELAALDDEGELDVFVLARRLGHRIGLASWAGPAGADPANFDRLLAAFDDLDGSESFVRPDIMAALVGSDKATERAALATISELVGGSVAGFDARADHPLFARIVDAWQDAPADERATGVAYDVALLHIASMSNLFAALGWALVDLLEHPEEQAAVAAGDRELAEQCALESTRLAQRSLMARYVLAPIELEVSDGTLAIEPGMVVATLLPLTNTSAGPGLEEWQPKRWRRWRLTEGASLPAEELVTAFGHGKHSCPAQPFSLAAMSMSTAAIFHTLELIPRWTSRPVPVPAQIGGVARAAGPCLSSYRRRSNL